MYTFQDNLDGQFHQPPLCRPGLSVWLDTFVLIDISSVCTLGSKNRTSMCVLYNNDIIHYGYARAHACAMREVE